MNVVYGSSHVIPGNVFMGILGYLLTVPALDVSCEGDEAFLTDASPCQWRYIAARQATKVKLRIIPTPELTSSVS
ncbi:hypothetical protein E2C01_081378 [Portunus trituberculatus]|uniref:Uncharacterized protein n=1 Tax=Portunus trituberculatus TaxID=210409 RepID=A0A5B7IYM5_PORTR|nr:hypothetical protein [Portunus trituberculatus]